MAARDGPLSAGSIPTVRTACLTLRAPDGPDVATPRASWGDADASGCYGGPLAPPSAWRKLAADLRQWSRRDHGVWAIETGSGGQSVGAAGIVSPEGWPRPKLT